MAVNRLLSTEKLFLKDSSFKGLCTNVNADCLKKGHIFKVELTGKEEKSRYLSHFANVRPDEGTTANTRFVFDASAKFSEISLNYAIYQGLKLQREIF